MQLTARDWSDLRWAAIVLIVCGAIDWLLMRYFRRMKHQPPPWMRMLDTGLIMIVIWLFALAPMLERRGFPRWLSIIVLVAIFLGGLSPILRKMRRDVKADAALRRAGDPSGGRNPQALMSKEEKRITFYLVLAIVAAVAAGALTLGLAMWAFPTTGQPLQTGKLTIAFGTMAFTTAAIVYPMFGRWPGKVSCRATIDIAAAPERVWDAIVLRDDYPGWKKIYTGIERLDEPSEVYRIHHGEDSHCVQCLLPRQPERSLWSSRVEVVEARRPSIYHLRSSSRGVANRGGIAQWMDHEEVTYRLQPLVGEGTRLTYSGTAFRPKMWLAILILLGGSAKENLRSLKAHFEGTPDESLYGVSAKRIEAARNASQHCACDA